jgi:hypothetical protein
MRKAALSATSVTRAMLIFLVSFPLCASTIQLTFDDLSDSTRIQDAYESVHFENAIVLTSGVSLNELEFPPHSGQNVAVDDGAPIVIAFDRPVSNVAAYITHNQLITLTAFDASGNAIGSVASMYRNNLAISGDVGSHPNELLHVPDAFLFSVKISGAPDGFSFALDDFSFDESTSIPEPSTANLLLVACCVVFLVLPIRGLHRRRLRGYRATVSLLAAAVITLLAPTMAISAPAISQITVTPDVIPSGVTTSVLVTANIEGASPLPGGVNLLRVDSSGNALIVFGVLHDDGKDGDAAEGDGIFSLQLNLTPNSGDGTILLQISAAFNGLFRRVLSEIVRVNVSRDQSEARQLASRVVNATSAANRRQALLDIFGAIGVGVYNSQTGNAIITGAERTDRDLYLYDFEVDLIGDALTDPKTSYTAIELPTKFGEGDIMGY